MTFRPGDRVFVDESKSHAYIVVAAAVAVANHTAVSRELRRLLAPAQHRVHFKNESDSRRRSLLAAMSQLDVRASVWVVRGAPDIAARAACLEAVVDAMIRDQARELRLESDVSRERADRQVISQRLARHVPRPVLDYRHVRPQDEPVLWISDAVAWSFQRRGDWLRRAEDLVTGRVTRL